MAPDADPEKGRIRRDSEIEKPPSHKSEKSEYGDGDDDAVSRKDVDRARSPDSDPEAAERRSQNHHDLVPAATVGEPSGNPAYNCDQECCTPNHSRTRSRASSARSRPLTIVPRARRRGLFGRFALVPEVERPYDYKNSTKWTITAAISLATAAAPMGSSVFYPALPVLSSELNATPAVANMSVALYMLSMSIFPLWWSSFSEQFGRRTIYLVSFALFVVFSALCAVSTNMAMLVVFRIGSGGASASVQAVGAGTIADIWETFERGRAMSIFYLGPLLGPLLAPIFGGILTENFGWQSNMWFLTCYGFACFLLLFFLLPETLAHRRIDEPPASGVTEEEGNGLSRVSTVRSAKIRAKKFSAAMKRFFIEPLGVLLFLRFPAVTMTVLVAAIAFGALFVANIGIQQTFSAPPYGYSQLIVGLLYIPPGLGYIVASFFGGQWMDKIMAREARKANRYDEHGKLVYLPEDRMKENSWIATTVYPLSLLAYGWTMRYGVHWMAPSAFLFCFGTSSMLVFGLATTMLTEFVRKKSSAGVAVNNFVRNILSCLGTVVAAPWISAIGMGWVFTTICIVCLFGSFLGMWLLRRYGPKWRTSMDEALRNM